MHASAKEKAESDEILKYGVAEIVDQVLSCESAR